MGKEEKRYVVKMDMYVYAENDYMARKRAHQMKKEIDSKYGGGVGILELGEQPFASFNYRKLEDHSAPRGKKGEEPLPF